MGFGGVVFSFPSQQSRDCWVSGDPYRKACAWDRLARHVETVLRKYDALTFVLNPETVRLRSYVERAHAWKARHASEGVIK